MTGPFSLLTVGGAQHAVSATDNSLQAETTQSTPTCSANGTHSDGYTGAFEGPEKLLEMWFAPTSSAARCVAPGAELCDEDHDQWSELRSGLSESSFFVYPNKLVLKTCGTTTLLYAIPRILAIAHQYLGATGVHQVFYSRKNF
ncbi:spermidine resistance protein, partial [Coemansia sp. RSA 2320]